MGLVRKPIMEWVHRNDEQASIAVVSLISEIEDCEPWELEPLGDVVDPDALDDLFAFDRSWPENGHVSFEYCGYIVSISSDGVVELDGHVAEDTERPQKRFNGV